MQPESRKYLYDIGEAGGRPVEFTRNKRFSDYQQEALLRSAVERQFEIIGEALTQLARVDESVVSQIRDYRRIISFRNILIHGYAQIDDLLVWDVVNTKLPALLGDVEQLLSAS